MGTMGGPSGGTASFHGANPVTMLARGDYAACAGDQDRAYFVAGPIDPAAARKMTEKNTWPSIEPIATGVSYFRSEVTIAMISDGTSKTYLIGEKYLNSDNVMNGDDDGDNVSMYSGYDNDNHRTTFFDGRTSSHAPMPDTPGRAASDCFGSPCRRPEYVVCDGSVQLISYTISPEVHRRLGNRKDGLLIDSTKL